jgi:hypothetical protein
MKKLLTLLCLSIIATPLFSQSLKFPFVGSYDLLPNEKVMYEFNKAEIAENSLKLFMNNMVYRCYDLTQIDDQGRYLIMQTFPMLPDEYKDHGNLKVVARITEEGLLHVLVNGPGTHTEHYFRKINR